MDDISLIEYGSWEGRLSEADAITIGKSLDGKLDINPIMGRTGEYRLKATSHVGFIRLPSGRTIHIKPKVQIETIFAMLAAVHTQVKFEYAPQSYSSLKDLFEFVVAIFARRTWTLLSGGIIKGYQERTGEMITVRGRIMFAETLRRNPATLHKHICRYIHFTADVPENRILKWAAFCLSLSSYRDKTLGGKLRRIYGTMADVELDANAPLMLDRLVYHRLNEHYRPTLELADMLLRHLTYSGSPGAHRFLGYLVDMNSLFEEYVAAVLSRNLRADFEIMPQEFVPLTTEGAVTVRPDVTIRTRDKLPLLAVDAKYKLEDHQADLNQMLAYHHALGVDVAVLVYPDGANVPDKPYNIRHGGKVYHLTLDLSGGPAEMAQQAGEFSAQIRKLAEKARQGVTAQ